MKAVVWLVSISTASSVTQGWGELQRHPRVRGVYKETMGVENQEHGARGREGISVTLNSIPATTVASIQD